MSGVTAALDYRHDVIDHVCDDVIDHVCDDVTDGDMALMTHVCHVG